MSERPLPAVSLETLKRYLPFLDKERLDSEYMADKHATFLIEKLQQFTKEQPALSDYYESLFEVLIENDKLSSDVAMGMMCEVSLGYFLLREELVKHGQGHRTRGQEVPADDPVGGGPGAHGRG